MTKASDNPFPSILIEESTEPSAPAAGHQRLYIDSTSHKLKRTDSSGTDVTIEGIANPMTTAGDVIYGGASGTPTRLAIGTAGQVLKVNSGATAPEWGAAAGGSLTTASAELATDVSVPNTGTVTDIVSVSLAAGTWLVIAKVGTFHADASNALACRLTDGTNDYDSCDHSSVGIRGDVACTLFAIITLASTTTIKVQAKANAVYTAKGAASTGVSYITTEPPTRIHAVKVA